MGNLQGQGASRDRDFTFQPGLGLGRERSIEYATAMLARASYLSASCVHLGGTHYLLKRSPLCGRSQACKVVRTRVISVKASAGQSGQQTAAGVKQQVVADSRKSTEQMSAAEGCLRFINHAWTQFHAVGESCADSLADCICVHTSHTTSTETHAMLSFIQSMRPESHFRFFIATCR